MGFEKFTISVGKDKLVGRVYFTSKDSNKLILFLNGSGGTKERFNEICAHFSAKGFVCVCFDFRGRGESVTKKVPKLKAQTKDMEEIINYLEKFNDLEEIVIVATSMGAYAATCVCNFDKKIKRLILIAPAIYPKNADNLPYTKVSAKQVVRNDLESSTAIGEIKKFIGELVVVSLSRDDTIMNWIPEAYLNNAEKASRKKEYEIDSSHAIFRSAEGKRKVVKMLDKILIK
jgi:alpha-beta hydrolase superfamily lysophospholipase